MTKKFSELGLNEAFVKATAAAGYEEATPIQGSAIPVILAGRDLVGCAQTGTGKTAAFTLPMLDRLVQSLPQREPQPQSTPPRGDQHEGRRGPKGANPRPRALRALVFAPTRELAAQIAASLVKYGKHTALRHAVVYGGVSQVPQVKALRHGVDVLVATPGRLIDLMGQGHIDLSKVEILVLDEADQMLDMGFLPDLTRIVARVPKKRQTLMFSATMPPAIRELAQKWLANPANIEVAPVATPADRITQSVHLVDKQHKPDRLSKFLKETACGRTLVFSRTKHGADKIVKRLLRDGLRAAAIHGNKSQGARTRTLEDFKGRNPPILVATDIAARGLDVRDVTHIINYDLPETPETYVHRIGRTARAGAEGVAVSFCSHDERKLLNQIERLMNRRIPVDGAPATLEHEPFVDERESARPRRPRAGQKAATAKPGGAKRPRTRTGGHANGNGGGAGGGKGNGNSRAKPATNGERTPTAAATPRKRRRKLRRAV